MTVVRDTHEAHGATFTTVGGHALPKEYGRPDRAHRAVRRVVGVTEAAYGVLVITGTDALSLLGEICPSDPPSEEGAGGYTLHLDTQGRIAGDAYVYHGGERVLCFTAPGTEQFLATAWREVAETAELAVDVSPSGDAFGVFGLHGPKATEKVASVLTGPGAPEGRYRFVRGQIGDNGVTVIRGADLAGEESYEVVCRAAAAERVFDALINHGLNAAPFGRYTWHTLTVEAGSPLYESELVGRRPAALGLGHLTPGPTRGPTGQLVGLQPASLPAAGDPVLTVDGSDRLGEVTRAVDAPTLDGPAALAILDGSPPERVSVGDDTVAVQSLPLVEGSALSARLPRAGED
ncbi:MAG: aminomethyl transferase family protein [Halobacteriaceae archaeon]